MTDCTRRQLLASGAALAAAGAARRAGAQPEHEHDHGSDRPAEDAPAAEAPAPQPTRRQKRLRAAGHTPVLAPDVPSLPWRIVGGVKVFHLVAQAFERTFTDGLEVACWGYNGHTPGPLIEAVEGERCRFYVTNELPEPTTVHWHGVILPSGMDGVGGLSQPVIEPGQTFVYEFTFQHPGTFLYHPHFDEMTQIALGMTGVIVVHPRRPRRTGRRAPRRLADAARVAHRGRHGAPRSAGDARLQRAHPQRQGVPRDHAAGRGDRRPGAHPLRQPEADEPVTGLDEALQPLLPGTMTMGATGMAGMAEMDLPMPRNSVPMKSMEGPFGAMDLGGMVTLLQVRDRLPASGDAGWYDDPPGTVARAASPAELARDGIDARAIPPAEGQPGHGSGHGH